MKTIKFFMLLVGMLLAQTLAFGQKITIKNVKLVSSDITASKNERKDAAGNFCAVVKVQIPTVTGLKFSNSVGNVDHSSGEYIVYVSPGIKTLTISDNNNATLCIVNFEKEEIEVTSKCTYQVELTQDQVLNKIFKIEPKTATLSVNGQIVVLGEDGVGSIECEVGKEYNYIISATGYETIEDAFMIDLEDESVEPINVTLDRKLAMVRFQTNVNNLEVLLDDESWGIVDKGQEIELPVGTWNVRLVADKYDDWISKVTVTEQSNIINASLNKSDDVSKKLRPRTSIYAGGGFAFPLESRRDMNKENVEGYPVRLGVDYETFMKRWLTFRVGVEAMIFCGEAYEEETPFSINVPLLFSMNAPLGKFNRNHFSVGIGPVVGYAELITEGEDSSENACFLFGGRIEARFSFNHFILGVNVDCLKADVLMDDLIAPMVSLGYKF